MLEASITGREIKETGGDKEREGRGGGCNLVAEIVSRCVLVALWLRPEIVSRIRGIVEEIFMKIYISRSTERRKKIVQEHERKR